MPPTPPRTSSGASTCPRSWWRPGVDVFTPARCSEAIHHEVVGSELVTFAEAGHTLPVEEPDELAGVLDDFVERRVAHRAR